MCWVLLGHFFLCQSTEGTVTRRWHQANWMMLVLVFWMDTSVLMHVRVQECCSSFYHSVSVVMLLHMLSPPTPVFLVLLDRNSLFCCECYLCGGYSCSGRAMRIHNTRFSEAPYNYSCVYRSSTTTCYVFRYQLYLFLKHKGQLVQLAFVARAPVKSDCKVNTNVPSSV